jgi:hypothetical protein
VIGNGVYDESTQQLNRSDALTVLFDGTTTIAGSVTATAFIGDGSQLTNINYDNITSSIWRKGEAGGVEFGSNEASASGYMAVAMGDGVFASGAYSTAMGAGSNAIAFVSTAMGLASKASGNISTAMGYQTEASGDSSTAMGSFTIASGNYSTAIGRNSIASGTNSFAIGYGASEEYDPQLSTPYYKNEALGSYSFVIGRRNKSSGGKSFSVGNDNLTSGLGAGSFGENNIASGDYSYSIGLFNQSIGAKSIALGNNSYADGFATTAIGSANTIDNNAQNEWSLNNRAFVIGNGVYDESTQQLNRSDALTVLFDGTTTIAGSVTATEFIGDGSQLTNLSVSSPFSFNDTSGNGIQALGTIASGEGSTAMGAVTTASGNRSTAMGEYTIAVGGSSTAMGAYTTASGNISTAMGIDTVASGEISIAMGIATAASGICSVAMGTETTASGLVSTAMGWDTTASDNNSLVIGRYNLLGSIVTNSATEFSLENTAFVIGNGADADNRSDALTVLFDGTTTIAGDLSINSDKKVFFGNQSFIEGATEGTVLILNANNNILFRPGGTTTVNFEPNGDAIFNGDVKVTSDKRLKSNIISLGSTLAKLLQIDGKTYTMKKDENKKQKIGVLAQDIEKVFPELVSESKGVKSVNYQGLVPVLINALKEQDSKMKEQESRIERLEKLLLDS